MSKRVPIYMSVQEMWDAKEALETALLTKGVLNMSDEEVRRRDRFLDIIREEIDRNTEPTGSNDEQ